MGKPPALLGVVEFDICGVVNARNFDAGQKLTYDTVHTLAVWERKGEGRDKLERRTVTSVLSQRARTQDVASASANWPDRF